MTFLEHSLLDVLFFFPLMKKETKKSSCILSLREIQQAAATLSNMFLGCFYYSECLIGKYHHS